MCAPLVPLLYPAWVLQGQQRAGSGRYARATSRSRIPLEQWAEVAARARTDGLRPVARDLGVSHETIRTIVNRVGERGWKPENQ